MKMLRNVCLTAMLSVFSWSVLASVDHQSLSYAVQKINDFSRQILVTIFGPVVNSPVNSVPATLTDLMPEILVYVFAVGAMLWFIVMTLRGMVKSGHTGRAFHAGRRKR